MDIKTLILALAVGNCIYAIVLILFQSHEERLASNPYWTAAKFLQGGGWLLLFLRGFLPDFFSITLANTSLIAGFAYECWAMYRISGKPVHRGMEGGSLLIIVICCLALLFLSPSLRIVVASFLSTVFFALAGRAVLIFPGQRSPLRIYVGCSLCLLALIVFARGILAFAAPDGFSLFTSNLVQIVTFSALFYIMLTGGFGVLLLTRESIDRELQEVLKEQEAILNTLPTGLCILRDCIIERCNPAMEAIFGFAAGTLVGNSVRCLFENDTIFRQYGKKIDDEIDHHGRFSGEIPYIRRNGERFWAWDQGTTIFPERSRSWAVFSITDISEQKWQQELLAVQKEELQKTLARIKRLEGIISICMFCKKIRNEQQSWEQLENYLIQNTDAMFSHGLCPECYEKEYGGNSLSKNGRPGWIPPV